MRPRLPTSLNGRLVLTAVSLVAVIGLLVGLATTLAMRGYLTGQLDDQVRALSERSVSMTAPPAVPETRDRDGGRDDEDEDRDFSGPGGPGTLTAFFASGYSGGFVATRSGDPDLEEEVLEELADVPVDGEVHSVDLDELGHYRVLATPATTRLGATVVVNGVPTEDLRESLSSLLLWQLLLTLLGVATAAVVGDLLVRRTLRPLREVAAAAREVTTLDLDTGSVGETVRVPAELTDPATEVGQVGASLNQLLGHVESALDARHRSELQVRQFVADASHELRTPLATILGYAELARRNPSYSPTDALTKVEAEGARMQSLVEDLLLLARLDAGRPLEREEVDLSLLSLEAVQDSRVLGPEHRWALELPDEPVTVTGDAHRLHQVLTNLLTNARRHTPPGTTVTVGLATTPTGADLTVTDNGPGIPPDLIPDVFERFTRADASRTRDLSDLPADLSPLSRDWSDLPADLSHLPADLSRLSPTQDPGGAGLGLALVQAIVQAHHGEVSVESTPGHTRFTVSLPR